MSTNATESTSAAAAETLDSKTQTLTTQPSSGGAVVRDLGDDVRVSGGQIGVVMGKDVVSNEPPSNGDVAVDKGVMVVDGTGSLDSKMETPMAQASTGGIIVQDLVDDANARVSGGEIGAVMDKDEKLLDESSSDAGVSNVPPSASDGVKTGDDLSESKSGTLIVETSGHGLGGGGVVQDPVDDARVSRDERVLDGSSSDAVVSSVPPAASDEVKTGADSLESKSGTLVTETSGHDGGGDTVVQDSIDDSRVSGDETEIVMENSEPISDAVNGIKIVADSLGSKSEALTTKPSADQNGGDINVPDSVDDSKVSGDEKGIEKENIEKVSDEKEVNYEEKEGEYKVADIVWAKVKNYPWWPGQIFDPSASTDKAKKYSNKKGYLIGYFGDQTFAWNKASNIKPFRKNFSKLEKQSNSKPFFHAVDCALDEISRRVDFGLACSCLSKEVNDKIKTQVFVNSGIREEASKIDGGDRFSTGSTFKPVKVVQSVQELAREHFDGFSRLEVLSMRTQLLAYFRWKGYYQFQAQNILDGPDDKLEDESELPLTEEKKVVEDEKPASVGKKVTSKKRKPDVSDGDDSDSDDSVPHKKERNVTNVTPKGNLGVEKRKRNSSKKAAIEDIVIKEENRSKKTDSVGKKVSSKKRKPDVSDSDDSVPRKKERSLANMASKGNSSVKRCKKGISKEAIVEDVVNEESGDEKLDSVGKKVSSKKRKPDVCDGNDSVPHKKERSLTDVTSKGDSSVKRSKKSISKNAAVEDVNEESGDGKPDSVGKKVSSQKRGSDVSDSDDSVPHKKEKSLTSLTSKGNSSLKRSKKGTSKKAALEDDVVNEESRDEKPDSVGKKVYSKKRKTDVCDSDDSVPRKKEKSLTSLTSKGNSSGKRSKKDISKKATVGDDVVNEESRDEKSVGKKVYSKRRKPVDCDSDDSVPLKKERSLTDVTSKGNSSVKRTKKGTSKKATGEDNVVNEESRDGTDNKKSSDSTPKKRFIIGDSICKIAKQISETPSLLKKESQKSKNDENSPKSKKAAKKGGNSVEAIQTEE